MNILRRINFQENFNWKLESASKRYYKSTVFTLFFRIKQDFQHWKLGNEADSRASYTKLYICRGKHGCAWDGINILGLS